MAGSLDYPCLYQIQDRVLKAGLGLETGLYLTGGTCLHRFYSERRYSDDLDFFCNDNELFRDYVREYREAIKNQGMSEQLVVDSRDFVRLKINDSLKVDFVNDRVYRYGRIEKTDEGFRIDNLTNLCANKLTAILGRDEPKDIFDLHTLSLTFRFRWSEMIAIAGKKCAFDSDYFIYRLKSFPLEMLDSLAVLDNRYCREVKDGMADLIESILSDRENIPPKRMMDSRSDDQT
ncbi:MAG: nucleotidyl transferase AbiEii/AbiGii toxin family protein [Candidatus Delongbacteria bacterium]|nr:nucleotidyl transferase AbiEii/AbiGii toxin family protein [Candidatus Delongbacteria bacterium]